MKKTEYICEEKNRTSDFSQLGHTTIVIQIMEYKCKGHPRLCYFIMIRSLIQLLIFPRSEHDKAYERWMPHINLIYPYLEDVMSHGSKGVFHAESQKILKHLGAVSPFR